MRAVKIKVRNIVILFFSLVLTLAVFSQVTANLKPTSDVGLEKVNSSDWLYSKANNDLSAYLGKKSSSLPTVRYQKGGDYLEFSMNGVSSTTSVSLETNVKEPNTPTLFYRNIFDGADVNYRITNLPFKVKEEIVLNKIPNSKFQIPNQNPKYKNSKQENLTYIFNANTNAKPRKQQDGSIAFFDNQNNYLFQLDKPFMMDAKGNRSEEVEIEIIPNDKIKISNQIQNQKSKGGLKSRTQNPNDKSNLNIKGQISKLFDSFGLRHLSLIGNLNFDIKSSKPEGPQHYTLTLTADSSWLSTATYPVVIDPTITHNADANFTGQMNRIADSDSTSNTQLESSYGERTNDPYTVLNLHFNEANGTTAGIRDYASTTRVITANGNASTTSYVTQLGMGNSAAFDGTGDFFSLPDSEDWNFGSGDFSIETWVNFNSVSADQVIVSQHQTADTTVNSFYLTFYGSTGTGMGFGFHNGTSWIVEFSQGNTNGWSAGQWYHIALVRSGDNWNIYRNGVSIASSNTSANLTNLTTGNLEIGRRNVSSDYRYTNGYLDSFRILKGRALTPEEIKAAASRRPYAVYTSSVLDATVSMAWNTLNWTEGGVNTGDGETLYNTSSLVAQWNFNETSGTTATSSTSGSCQTCAGTLTNFVYTSSQDQATTTTGWTANNKKWGAGALMMESAAAADYVSISDPASNVLDPGTGDFTIEGWIKSSAAGQDTIIQNNTTSGACASNAGYILIVNGNRNLAAYASDGTNCYVNNLTANASSTEIADGRWHHFAFVADRDTKAYVYLDGRLTTSTTINNTTAANPAATIYFGASGATGDSDFILDSMRYYSRALSASEVLSNSQTGNVEIQTRTGATSDPNDGTWEAWRPVTGETQLLSVDSDAASWNSDIMASTTIATSTDTVIKMEGTGSLKVRMGMASTTAGTVALWHFEETGTTTGTTLYDSTANANNATTTGTTIVDGIFGKARKFNGTSDVVNLIALTGGTAVQSVDFWVYPLTTTEYFVDLNGSAYVWANAGTVTATGFTSPTIYVNGAVSSAITAGQWQHIAVTTGTGINASSPKIGKTTTNFLEGTIDEIRTLNRILSADEIAESYRMGANHHLTRQVSATDMSSANKLAFNVAADRPGTYLEAMLGESDYANYELASSTLALSTNTVLYIKGDEIASSTSIKDSSSSGKAITANGDARTSGNGKIGNSVYFDGTGDYLSVAAHSDWNFGTGDWTIDLWHKSSSDNSFSSFISLGSADREITIDRNVGKIKIYVKSDDSTWIANSENIGTVNNSNWQHVALVRNGNTVTGYVDGVAGGSWDVTGKSFNISAQPVYIGIWRDGTNYTFIGNIDEVRVIKGTALSADQIRQAYEYGLRSHQITIDFGATLQPSDLISNSTDYSFSLTATTSGLSATTSGLYLGDKIVIKENLGGTEYAAQGMVNAINTTTGAITVPSWDTGSTFPSGNGYSPNATVFKWQREYFDLGGAATTTRNAITNLTLRPTNNGGGRTVWLDDFRYNTNYLTASSSSSITSSNNRYLQYRAIFSSWDSFVSPYLSAINTLYTSTANMFGPLIGISGGGFLSF